MDLALASSSRCRSRGRRCVSYNAAQTTQPRRLGPQGCARGSRRAPAAPTMWAKSRSSHRLNCTRKNFHGVLPSRKAGAGRARGAAQTQSLGRILNYPAKRVCKRGRIVWLHENSSAVWHRLRYCACAGADDGETSGDGFGISHAVTLETRGKDEHISLDVKLSETLRRHLTENGNPIAEPMKGDVSIKLSNRFSVTRAVANDRQSPR